MSEPHGRLAMVYDADGGLAGELRYVVGHLLGRAECALCDITHGPVRRKADFDALVRRLAAAGWQAEAMHRNEQDAAQASASAGQLPCVLVERAGGRWEVLVDRGTLRACEGDVARLDAELVAALGLSPA